MRQRYHKCRKHEFDAENASAGQELQHGRNGPSSAAMTMGRRSSAKAGLQVVWRDGNRRIQVEEHASVASHTATQNFLGSFVTI